MIWRCKGSMYWKHHNNAPVCADLHSQPMFRNCDASHSTPNRSAYHIPYPTYILLGGFKYLQYFYIRPHLNCKMILINGP